MPTTVTKTVIPAGGGDYSSLSAWEAGRQANLVSADTIEVAECSGSTADTTATTISGWTTDATRYAVIQSSGSNKHTGVWTTSKYNLSVTNITDYALICGQDYTRVIGLQVSSTVTSGAGTSNTRGISILNNCRVSDSIIRLIITGGTAGSTGAIDMMTDLAGATGYIYNNLVLIDTSTNAGFAITGVASSGVLYIENNTIIKIGGSTSSRGITSSGAGQHIRNNLVKGFSNTSTYLGSAGSSTNNTTDSTDTTFAGIRSQTFTFTNSGAGDYSLAAGDTGARDNGTALTGISSGFTTDIVGTTRDPSGAIDCGCFEYGTLPTVDIPRFAHHYSQQNQ